MDLLKEILVEHIKNEAAKIEVALSNLDIVNIVEMKCYQAIKKIKEIVEDDTADDKECFFRVEKIVCALEDIGSGGGFRHDF